MNDNKGQTIFLSVIGIATLLVAIVGATFAWFSATVTHEDIASNSVIVRTASLGTINFLTGNTIDDAQIYPGWSNTKTVSIATDPDKDVDVLTPYYIDLHVVTNEFTTYGATAGNLLYSVSTTTTVSDQNSGEVVFAGVTDQVVPGTTTTTAIISGVLPATKGVTHTYTVTFSFPETSSDQNSQQGRVFEAYLTGRTGTNQEQRYTYNANNSRIEYTGQ